MMIEGILSIQAGDNPRIVEEKLKTFLEPGERKHFEEEGGARDAGGLDGRRPRWRRKRAHEHADERWLLTYADMITLLMALFMVLFSMAVVNKGKFEELAKSLQRELRRPTRRTAARRS